MYTNQRTINDVLKYCATTLAVYNQSKTAPKCILVLIICKIKIWPDSRAFTHVHTDTCIHRHTHAHIHKDACTHMHACIHTHARTNTCTHTHTHKHVHAHMWTRTHMPMHTHTHTNTEDTLMYQIYSIAFQKTHKINDNFTQMMFMLLNVLSCYSFQQ